MSADLSNWIPEPEAAALIGRSERTLRRMAAEPDGPERRERQRAGRKAEPVYNPADIEKLATATGKIIGPGSQLLPRPGEPGPVFTIADLAGAIQMLAVSQQQLVKLVSTRLLEPPPAPPTMWMTLPQASAYTGISVAILMAMIHGRKLAAFRDRGPGNGPIKVKKDDLDKLSDVAELSRWGQKLTLATDDLRQVVERRKRSA